MTKAGFVDAADYGFSPSASSAENTRALQAAVDQGGTIQVSRPGTYEMANTVFIGSHTTLNFGSGVFLKKDASVKPFSHVLLNKGALTRTYDENICVQGLQIVVNGVDVREWLVHGLHGQLAFFYVKDLKIERFRCMDIGTRQYGIHICTFLDIIVDDVIIKGDKDGVHLGRGKRFTIRNGIFTTYDDAVALNAHDYAVGNPEMGWIEDGVVENCHDLCDSKDPIGFFCRIIAGAWLDWHKGMQVQQSDIVVCNDRLYRVHAQPDGKFYTSTTPPSHTKGVELLDGIPWVMAQEDVTYTAGVRNVVFRDIFHQKNRVGYSIHFDNDKYSRSIYPGASAPTQELIFIDHASVGHGGAAPLVSVNTPVDSLSIRNCVVGKTGVHFRDNNALPDYGKTTITVIGCVFKEPGETNLVINEVAGKRIKLTTNGSTELFPEFPARVDEGPGQIAIDSDLTGLRQHHTV
jgi:hypothetical protein